MSHPEWEYETIECAMHDYLPEKLAEQGREGWELVSALESPWARTIICIFKRRKP